MLTKIYAILFYFTKPIIKFFASIHAPFSKKKVTGKHYYKWRDKIKIGTVFLTKTEGELSNLINPAKFKHSGIYVGKIFSNNVCYVAEAVGRGIVFTDLVTFLTTKDIVVGCRPNFIRNEASFTALLEGVAKKVWGVPYDYYFDIGPKAFYCFEFCAYCYKQIFPQISFKCNEIIKNKKIYDGNTFLDETFFDVIFDSREGN